MTEDKYPERSRQFNDPVRHVEIAWRVGLQKGLIIRVRLYV